MSLVGIDTKTYTGASSSTNVPTNNTNYYGTTASTSFYTFTTITSFTNNWIILAAGGAPGLNGGAPGLNGGHAIQNSGSGIIIKNYGSLLGGGGGGSGGFKGRGGSGGIGGGGGGGGGTGDEGISGDSGGSGGSIFNKNGSSSLRFSGGGGGAYVSGIGGSGYSSSVFLAGFLTLTLTGGNGGNGGNGTFLGSNGGLPGSNPSEFGGSGGGSGGGAAFGGNGNNGISTGGSSGGGSGGGRGGSGNGSGGNGGYSIYNTGTITSLYNSQGVNTYYGPLFYGGTSLPTNYYIRINSITEYGQLFCTGWGEITSGTFNNIYIDPSSSISLIGQTTLSSVLVGNCFTTTSGTGSLANGMSITYSIIESTPNTLTVGSTSYKSYDLVITPIAGYGIMAASSLTLSGYLNNPAPSISYYIDGLNKTSTTTGMVSIQNTSNNVSLYANYVVASGTGFTINSDQRIKKNVEYLSSAESLKLVNVLKPASFQYVDSMKGIVPKYGYLAQEVESVFPNLVYQNPAYIPNFYEIVKIEDSRRIILPTKNTESLAIGTKLQFYDIQNVVVLREVESIIDETSFTVTEAFLEGVETLFLYGQEVADYRSIDTDQINTVLLSALQETNKKIADQDKEIDGLKRTVEELGKKIDDSLQI